MKNNWLKSLDIILHHEGGYVNHPKDPGGETNLGVTKRVYEEHGGTKNMKDLTVEDVAPIYLEGYWDKVKGDDLPPGLDLAVFDFAVNAGPGRAAQFLQRLVNCEPDGAIGPNTLKTLEGYIKKFGLADTIENYTVARKEYYKTLSTFDTFGKGWIRRTNETYKTAMNMMMEDKIGDE
jgi:lysozyme family protein